MKKTKKIAIASLVFFTAVLAACSSSVSSSQTYSYVYSGDPDSLDYVIANRETTSAVTGNLVDGLLENDKYGNLVPSLAEKWTVSKDGLTYTYTLRKGAKWYTSDGEEYADVKAQDFITGLKHAADGQSEALYLVQNSIKGLDAYIKGESKDFSTVGVKALDDHTVQYTLNQPESYWNSKTTSGILFPVNADFLASQGSGFGAAKPSSILYNGPYLLKSLTAKSSIEYKKNTNYWDKDNVLIENVKLSYYDGSDQESLVRNFTDGAYTLARVFPNSSNYASVKKKYADNITYSQQGGTSFFYVFNVNRQAYHHTAKIDDKQKADTKAAILNKDFRQAVGFAFDRKAYAAQTNGEDGATMVLRNLAVPPTFVQIKDKNFGEVVQEKLTTLGQEWSSVKLDDAQDGLYNVEKAKAEFAKAKATLETQGANFPIHLDMPVSQADKAGIQQASSFKQSVESALGKENVVVDLQQMSADDFNNTGYLANTAAQKDYDLSTSGWTPDYQDPSTYLDVFDPTKGGLLTSIGLEAGQNQDIVSALGLNEYKALNDAANKEISDVNARYEKYAVSQAWLTDSGLTIPSISNGANPLIQRSVPFTRAYSWIGTKGTVTNYKYLKLQKDVLTTKEYTKAFEDWTKEKKESNEKAQSDLANHVE